MSAILPFAISEPYFMPHWLIFSLLKCLFFKVSSLIILSPGRRNGENQEVYCASGCIGAATLLRVMISGLIIYFAFDENVWLRPITTTPSPLPLEIIINRISFNTFYKKEHSPPEASTQDHSRHFCLEGYNCHMSNYSKNWRASIAPTVSQDENAQVRGDLEQTRRIIGDLDDRAFPPTSSSIATLDIKDRFMPLRLDIREHFPPRRSRDPQAFICPAKKALWPRL
ncbi:hypothetical protein DL96DRAFT_1709250 [Flagelloscypha sp. PMI_526]|nr:hypothetical protein DL96DRAFT_1709250 [Flagelloscypha sp. PMI_526]